MREISVSSAAQGFAGPREVKESTLPSATSRMRLSRLIPTTNALPARHACSASPDMVALLRVPAALFADREAVGQAPCPYPCTRPSSSASSDFHGCRCGPCSRPRAAQHPCRARTDHSLCLAVTEVAVCAGRCRPRHRFLFPLLPWAPPLAPPSPPWTRIE